MKQKYDRVYGEQILRKYLSAESFIPCVTHSLMVGEICELLAVRIKERNPDVYLDPKVAGFLGCVHDIGRSVAGKDHELHTIDLLLKEGIPRYIAERAMHGQLPEQYGREDCYPIGLEGMILTYADMSVKVDGILSVDERAKDIIERYSVIPGRSEEERRGIVDGMVKALPRFKRYEKVLNEHAGIKSLKELYVK